MRFRGTLVLLILCIGVGAFLYFYEIKGGEKRETAKREENRIWKLDSGNIQQIDLASPGQHVTAVRGSDRQWKITAPRSLQADSEELDRLAGSASDISRESIIETQSSDLNRFGLSPPQVALELRTKDGKQYKILFGNNNPTGSSTYATQPGKSEVFVVTSSLAGTFHKKLDDLRNHSVLAFDQPETQSLDVRSSKGTLQLTKENDRWWLQDGERRPADSAAVNGILGALSGARIKEFFEGAPEDYANLGLDSPTVDVKLTYGKDKGLKHLVIGNGKSQLLKKGEKKSKPEGASDTAYVARDDSRNELFYVDKDLVDKLMKSPADLRDKALASFQRWDLDSIALTNEKGTLTFTKSSGDWLLGDAKKKAKWDAVNGILDALEKPVRDFVDKPGAPSTYGLDKPTIRVILKQAGEVKIDCAFGKPGKDGVYAQVKGESSVKVADKDAFDKLNKNETDFLDTTSTQSSGPEAHPKQ